MTDVPAAHALEPTSLDETLRILDVASALRLERETAQAQLEIDEVKARLRARLRATAEATGEAVNEAEIAAAVDRYFGSLWELREPPPGLATTLAHLWVRRHAILAGAAAVVGLVVLCWWLFAAGPLSPAAREGRQREASAREVAAAEQAQEERRRGLDEAWRAVETERAAVLAMAREASAKTDAEALGREAEAGRASGDLTSLRATLDKLGALRALLDEEYELRIVSRPGERSGVDAYYEDERGKRLSGYYVVVEAVTSGGQVLARPIRDAEDGRTRTVRKWGEQVPKAVWDRIAADKRADGVVDESVFARKRRGFRGEEVVLGEGGAPLVRGRQITTNL